MTYKLTSSTTIVRLQDNAFIPADLANTDYRDYLAWVAEGNTPIPYVAPPAAVEPPAPTLSELQAQLTLLTLQINNLSANTSR